MDEFALIADYLRPLAGKGALGLTDDIALVDTGVVSADMLVAGVHFRPEDPLDRVARKAIRVNVSDIIAKGCTPTKYLLSVAWPNGTTANDVALFAQGLGEDQAEFGCTLLGGDTTRAPAGAPLVVSVTMFGVPTQAAPVLRCGASLGDLVMMTGTVGDGYLGLLAAMGERADLQEAIPAYELPSPPIRLAEAIGSHASAACDVSDGLVADAGHVAKASACKIHLYTNKVPLSSAGNAYLASGGDIGRLASGGDDYQALMCVPAASLPPLMTAAKSVGVQLTQIGDVVAGEGVALLDPDGAPIALPRTGYSHF